MKRFCVIFTLIVCLLTVFNIKTAFAADFGAENLTDALPDEARETLEESNITPENSGAASLTFGGVLSGIWELAKDKITKPLRMLCSLFAVILLCALAQSFTESGNLKGVFATVGVLCGAGIAAAEMSALLSETLGVLSAAANFTTVFIPVFCGIAAVLGHINSAAAVNTTVLAATQLFSQLAVNFLAPLCGAILGVSTAGAVNPELKLDKLAEPVKKFTIWALTLIMTVFMSVLSLQTLVTSGADNAAIKTAKFAVSQGVPIVGSTISDAVNTLSSGLSMLKGSVGSYGIIAVAIIVLPAIAALFLYKLALLCAEALAEMFALKELSALFKSCGAIMTIILAVTFSFLLLNTIAALMMFAAARGGD